MNFIPVLYYKPLTDINNFEDTMDKNRSEFIANLMDFNANSNPKSAVTPLFPMFRKGISIITPKMGDSYEFTYLNSKDQLFSISIAIKTVALILVWYWLSKIRNKFKKYRSRDDNILDVSIQIFGFSLGVSQKEPKLRHQKIILITILFTSMILITFFQALMIKKLVLPPESKDINSLEELLDTNLTIRAPNSLSFFLNGHDGICKLVQQHKDRLVWVTNETRLDAIDRVIKTRDSALIVDSVEAQIISDHYDNEGKLMHITEKVLQYPTSFLVLKTSAYQNRFNQILLRVFDSGLINKLSHDNSYKGNLQNRKHNIVAQENLIYTMSQLKFVFYRYIACMIVSTYIFIGELLVFHCQKYWNRRIQSNHNKVN